MLSSVEWTALVSSLVVGARAVAIGLPLALTALFMGIEELGVSL